MHVRVQCRASLRAMKLRGAAIGECSNAEIVVARRAGNIDRLTALTGKADSVAAFSNPRTG